jgi:hypothetical protein
MKCIASQGEYSKGNSWNHVEVEVTLRPRVSQPGSLGVRRPSGTRDQFYFLLEIFFRQLRVCNFVAASLTRGRVCNLLYNYFWPLPEQSLLSQKSRRTHGYILLSHLRLPQLQLIYDRQPGAHLGPVTNFSFSLKFLLDSRGFVIL